MSNYLDSVITFLSGVVIPIVIILIKQRRDKNISERTDKIQEEVKFSTLIDHKLDAIRDDYKTDRVWLCQFHNGGHFYPTGKSIQKFSMFYESVSPYASSIKFQFQNIPINLFSKSINELLTNDYISMGDVVDSGTNDFGLRYIVEGNQTKSLYIVAIRDMEGKFIGMLGMSYTKRKNILTNEELLNFRMEASRMGGELIKHLRK